MKFLVEKETTGGSEIIILIDLTNFKNFAKHQATAKILGQLPRSLLR